MSLSEQRQQFSRRQRGKTLQAALMVFVIGLCGTMIADLWDDVRYDLSTQPVRDLGRAEEASLDLAEVPDDCYVKIRGIIGNRGAVVKGGRVSALVYPERWYRQLVGSPILIEIEVGEDEARRERYSMFTELTIQGRARRLHAHSEFANVLAFYKNRYGYEVPPRGVVISVDRIPGQQHGALIGVILLCLVALSNIGLLVLLIRRKPRIEATAPDQD
ncbi:MAG: hypothetical protein ABIJ09_03430 [Pseudomonadota bacterium]